jgi:mevalonate kinase
MLKDKFPAKVLLFGEYTILNGSKALAIPFNELEGKWTFENNETEIRLSSQKSLRHFLEKSGATNIDIARMRKDLDDGLWFQSDIPQGFGLGSSGAVIAAIFHRYGQAKNNLQLEKIELAALENFFHGSSSGLDPLVSHIQQPLLIHSFKEVEVLDKWPNMKGFFLLNTGQPRQTGPLVSIYQKKMQDPQFKQRCADILAQEVNFAIEAVIKNDSTNLSHHLWHISKFQWDFFPEMIPSKELGPWTRGIESGDYILKLCGAGGGGFILGHSHKYSCEEMRQILNNYEIKELK